MKEDQYYLFVYGSLREGFHHPAHEYISRYFSFVAKGKIRGKLSDMGAYPAATPAEEAGFITGELYVIRNPEEFKWAIEQLDEYEGLFPEEDEGEKILFRREMTAVLIDNGEVRNAWVYWYNGDVSGRPVIESGDLLAYIAEKNNQQS
ncbi:gamma-glutamylcyclotransferase [soil metagenome]